MKFRSLQLKNGVVEYQTVNGRKLDISGKFKTFVHCKDFKYYVRELKTGLSLGSDYSLKRSVRIAKETIKYNLTHIRKIRDITVGIYGVANNEGNQI